MQLAPILRSTTGFCRTRSGAITARFRSGAPRLIIDEWEASGDATTRARCADARDATADARDSAADARDVVSDDREAAADHRELRMHAEAMELDRQNRCSAAARGANADAREIAADAREALADGRDAVADSRDRITIVRMAEADRRIDLAAHDCNEYHRALHHYTQLVRHRIANPLQIIGGMAATLLVRTDLNPDTRGGMLAAIVDQARVLERVSLCDPELQGSEERELRPKPFE